MRPSSTITALAALGSSASASSPAPHPFLLLSTHKSSQLPSVPQYAAQSVLLDTVQPYLSGCPTSQYLIINQADLHSSDIYSTQTIPNLRRHVKEDRWQDRIEVGEVHHGTPIDEDFIAQHIRTACPDAVIETQYLPSLGKKESRAQTLESNDIDVNDAITKLVNDSKSMTLIYFGGAVDADLEAANSKEQYVAEFADDGAHLELKRQLASRVPKADDSDEDEDWPAPPDTSNWTFFQRYSWLSQGQTIIIITMLMFAVVMVFAMQQVTSITIPEGSFDAEFVQGAATAEKKKSK